jgi:hypothetical protein
MKQFLTFLFARLMVIITFSLLFALCSYGLLTFLQVQNIDFGGCLGVSLIFSLAMVYYIDMIEEKKLP